VANPWSNELLKARGILQDLAIPRWKLRDICVAEALNSDREEQVKAELFHAQPNENEISHGGVDGKLAGGDSPRGRWLHRLVRRRRTRSVDIDPETVPEST